MNSFSGFRLDMVSRVWYFGLYCFGYRFYIHQNEHVTRNEHLCGDSCYVCWDNLRFWRNVYFTIHWKFQLVACFYSLLVLFLLLIKQISIFATDTQSKHSRKLSDPIMEKTLVGISSFSEWNKFHIKNVNWIISWNKFIFVPLSWLASYRIQHFLGSTSL